MNRTLRKDAVDLIHEMVQMDRWNYIDIIQEKKGVTSAEMTREILAKRKKCKPKDVKKTEIKRNNPSINARLGNMTDLGLLNNYKGKYVLTSMGIFISKSFTRLDSKIGILRKYKTFFDTHDYGVIPSQLFLEIHRLHHAKQCDTDIEYYKEMAERTRRAEYRICTATDHLHDIPEEFRKKMKQGELVLRLIYQFRKPFELNFGDDEEREIWEDLTHMDSSTVELRYLTLEDRSPIGIRIIDDGWALFNLSSASDNMLNRSKSFYGTDKRFVSWVEDIYSSLWEMSEPLAND